MVSGSHSMSSFSMGDMDKEAVSGVYRGKGCWCSPVKGFIMVLLAILLALAVGLIVHFFDPSKVGCSESDDNTAPTTEGPPVPEAIDYRLPENFLPSVYNLRLRPDIYTGDPETFTFTGSVSITVTCKSSTDKIILHSRQLDIDQSSVQVVEVTDAATDGAAIGVKTLEWDSVREFTTIPLEKTLEKDKQYKVSMSFTGPILSDLRGIYYSSYTTGTQTTYVLASQLQPTDARKVFPCFDEPNFKATFDVAIERKSHFTAMANGKLTSTEDLDDGWKVDYFAQTPHMSTYLLAFIVSDFDCVTSFTSKNQRVDICARPNAMNQTELANNVSAPIQEYLEDYHNVSYPLDKTVHAAVPDFAAGAMENWGLIIYRDYNLLFNAQSSTSTQEQRIVVVIAHELAHMWFGNLVSMDWWDDVWLNEGFASYMETLGTAAMEESWDMENDLVLDKLQSVMVADSLATSHPVFQAADTPEQITALFDSITYDKGASVIRMMRNFLGEEIFRWGLSNYLKDRAYQTATHGDLFAFLTEEASNRGKTIDVAAVMNTWILQMGYPVVTYDFDKVTRKITVSQKHFLLDPKSADSLPTSPYNYQWQVPISYVTNHDDLNDLDNEAHYQYWLTGESSELDDLAAENSDWIVGNVKERFYYRVNYNQENWDALIATLTSSRSDIEVKNRAQLVDDSFNLGRAGELNQTLFLDISKYLKDEADFLPWWSATRALVHFDLILGVTGDYGYFLNYVRQLFQGQYTSLGWDEAGDTHVHKLMRSLLLQYACYYGLPDCVSSGTTQFSQWMATPSPHPIVPNLRYTVYCTGISAGGQEEWDFAFSQFKQADSGAEERTIMQALACTKEGWLLRRYLEMALEEVEIRRQDFSTVFLNVADNTIGRTIAWEFLVNNWDTIYSRLGQSISFDRIVTGATKGFSSEYHYDLVKTFMESRDDFGSANLAFKQGLETIRSNIDWKEANQDAVREWLLANQS